MAGTSISLHMKFVKGLKYKSDEGLNSFYTCTKGNYINVLSYSPTEKIEVLVFYGGLEEFKASTSVEKITYGPYIGYNLEHHAQPFLPLPPNRKLELGEVYHPVPLPYKPIVCPELSADQESCRAQIVKIVLTKVQLEMMLSSAGKFQYEDATIQFMESSESEQWSQTWRSSLDTIKEVQGF